MDVAGALGVTAIFPALIGVILSIASAILWESANDRHREVVARRVFWTGVSLIGLAVALWIAAIWLGYAQGAVS